MKKLNKKGFTLIELLAVIVILGILMLIAIPSVTRYINKSRQGTFKNTAQLLIDSVRTDVVSSNKGVSCYVDVAGKDIVLEKGSKEGFVGYIIAEIKDDGTYNYRVDLLQTKYKYSLKATEAQINDLDFGDTANGSFTTSTATTVTAPNGLSPCEL